MNLRILIASFGLVFLAELGDKTQLAALAFSAESRSPWSVFLGTSLALICTTALAVMFGEALSQRLPAKAVSIGSGAMFILVGLVLLVNEARKAGRSDQPEPTRPPAAEEALAPPAGVLSAFVLKQAAEFERELIADLRAAAAEQPCASLRQAVGQIADEHARHLGSLDQLAQTTTDDTQTAAEAAPERETLLALLNGSNAERGGSGDPAERLQQAVARQEAAAQFYLALARLSRLHQPRDTLRWLAMDEIRHAERLCELIHHPPSDTV